MSYSNRRQVSQTVGPLNNKGLSMKTRIYIDTNVFLHYQPFDQIDWLEVSKSDSVVLVIPPVTIRELNHHKDSHPRVHIKKRASEAIRRLTRLFDSGQNAKFGNNVAVLFEDRDPVIDFTANHLSPNIQDDQLIASMIMDRQESPDGHLILITSDLGLTLSAKAGRHGIDTIRMPEKLRLADESDQNENKIKQLEQQVRELSIRVPKLSLSYKDETQHSVFTLSKAIVLSQADIEQKISELKGKYPKRENSGSPDKPPSSGTNLTLRHYWQYPLQWGLFYKTKSIDTIRKQKGI
jgi:predicted ribonuclease YlaK